MTRLFFPLVLAVLAAGAALAGDIYTERVQFHKGANSATIEGRIQGDMTIDYLLGARKGQSMNVSLATDNGANYFNIIAPGKENEALFVGSSSGNQFEGALPASGDYKIRVYLMRSAARRDEIANYRLEMIID
ncbi:DNA breaking-rejoining protein [Thiorhodococcus mannitoliphagus]|uniref:DNA breaking-rejoining protein n=1 Tax=Thiorhodococcus mannitoliphagus TaxID=329406 RepID=A0A6P1DYU4_9GAMM|nr:DNA breaking-rejoining protein [Thiorhodococcus mannitoliphagus]NEX21332.1 DNA breaking-rejoining protein [Thiorhodococcus mannitoliphagus]